MVNGFGEGTPPAALGDYTGFLVNWIAMRSRQAFAGALAELGLTPPKFGLMTVIAANPGMIQQDLVAATHIDPSTMVATLDALEEADLAERRPHPSDRRKRIVRLTTKGKRTLKAASDQALEVGKTTFGALSADEFTQFHRLVRKVAGLDPS